MFDQAPRDNDIRRAMDACLPGLENEPSLELDVLRRIRGEGKAVKKKLSVGVLLAIVFALMFATIAFAMTLNLFDRYGQTDPRLTEIAPQAMMTPAVAAIQNDHMGPSTVSVTNAYYDGNALLIGYTIENPEHIDDFTPTAEQLAQMKPDAPGFSFNGSGEKAKMLADEYAQARRGGVPFGVVQYKVYLSMDAYSDQGVHLGTWTEFNGHSEQNLYASIRDFDMLPKEARGLERLNIRIPIYQSRSFFYDDGERAYTMETLTELPPITFAVASTPNEIDRYVGDAVDRGLDMRCTVEATAVRLSAKLSGKLPDLPDGCYYDMCLKDADGRLIEASSLESQDDRSLVFTFRGTGTMPSLQTAHLLIVGDESGTSTVGFRLTRRHEE